MNSFPEKVKVPELRLEDWVDAFSPLTRLPVGLAPPNPTGDEDVLVLASNMPGKGLAEAAVDSEGGVMSF